MKCITVVIKSDYHIPQAITNKNIHGKVITVQKFSFSPRAVKLKYLLTSCRPLSKLVKSYTFPFSTKIKDYKLRNIEKEIPLFPCLSKQKNRAEMLTLIGQVPVIELKPPRICRPC